MHLCIFLFAEVYKLSLENCYTFNLCIRMLYGWSCLHMKDLDFFCMVRCMSWSMLLRISYSVAEFGQRLDCLPH